MSKQSGWVAGGALFLQGHTPTGGPQSVSQLRTGYVLGWTLPNRWDFDAGFRFGTDKDHEGEYAAAGLAKHLSELEVLEKISHLHQHQWIHVADFLFTSQRLPLIITPSTTFSSAHFRKS